AEAGTHEHAGPVRLHPAPGGELADLAALRDRVLAQGVLSPVLPGDGGAGPALCLPALPPGRDHQLRVRRGADRDQLLPPEQRVRLHRQPAELAALAGGRGARPALYAAVSGRLRVAGVAALGRWRARSSCSAMAPGTRSGGCRWRRWPRACARCGRTRWCAAPTWNSTRPACLP